MGYVYVGVAMTKKNTRSAAVPQSSMPMEKAFELGDFLTAGKLASSLRAANPDKKALKAANKILHAIAIDPNVYLVSVAITVFLLVVTMVAIN